MQICVQAGAVSGRQVLEWDTHWFSRRALTALLSGKPISVSWRRAISSTLSSSSSSSMAAHTQTKHSSDSLQPHINPPVNAMACVKFNPHSLSHPFFCFCPQFATSSCNLLHSARTRLRLILPGQRLCPDVSKISNKRPLTLT